MQIETIVKRINQTLADENLRYDEVEPHLDRVIDDINQVLGAKYPAFSEWTFNDDLKYDGKYEYFPEKYIRSVVIVGAAYYWYQQDEEGEDAASSLGTDYQKGLFLMTRDWLVNVPPEWQNDKEGYAEMDWDLNHGWGIDWRGNC